MKFQYKITVILFVFILITYGVFEYQKRGRRMSWREKIEGWKRGDIQTYPFYLRKRFFWKTSICDQDMENEFKEVYIESDKLDGLKKMERGPFDFYIQNSTNPDVVAFNNLSNTTRLIIPMPREGKNYISIKDFIDNAPKKQQKVFWKRVGMEIEEYLKKHKKVYVNTHGLGVYYFHLRFDKEPIYY